MDMETCKEVLDTLTEYLEDGLSEIERAAFEEHMQGCVPCDAFFQTYRTSKDLAAAALRAEQVPAELQVRVRSFLRQRLGISG